MLRYLVRTASDTDDDLAAERAESFGRQVEPRLTAGGGAGADAILERPLSLIEGEFRPPFSMSRRGMRDAHGILARARGAKMLEISCTYVQGRRIRELHAPKPRLVPVLGVYLANAAFYRATSAIAHERLTRELEAFGAPRPLLDGCALATLADRAHAAELARLAEARGVPSVIPSVEDGRLPIRSMLDVAMDNAVEGVVRQNFGVAIAHHRARNAGDLEIRSVMKAIADEAEAHAELACDVTIWLHSVLDPVECVLVEDAIRHAAASLPREIDIEPEPILCERAGIPGRLEALTIWRGFTHRVSDDIAPRVWAAAA